MAVKNTVEAHIIGKFDDKASGAAKSTFNKIGSAAKKIGIAAGIAGAGITALTAKAVEAANAQEAAEKKLETALRTRGKLTQGFFDELKASASAFQELTAVGDESILEVQANLISFGAEKENIGAVTQAVLDLSAGMGGDLKSASLLMGKALSGEFGTLSRYGIIVDKNAEDSEKMALALQQINDKFGGQSAAKMETFGGKIQAIKGYFSDLLEKVGFLITKNEAFNGVVDQMISTVKSWITSMEENRAEATEMVAFVGGALVTGFKAGVDVIKVMVDVMQTLSGWWSSSLESAANFTVTMERLPETLASLPDALLDLGGRIIDSFKEGIFSKAAQIKDSVKSTILGLIPSVPSLSSVGNSVSSFLGFGSDDKKASSLDSVTAKSVNSADRVVKPVNISSFSSKASGMPYVPFDRFPALLHRGEQVIPAGSSGGGMNFGDVKITIQGESKNPKQLARELFFELQRLNQKVPA